VNDLFWPTEALDHQTHGLTPEVAEEVRSHRPQFFLNLRGGRRVGSHMMIGPNSYGILWTVVILRTGEPGVWECKTGWPSGTAECELYKRIMMH
jgi:hypothetical protein